MRQCAECSVHIEGDWPECPLCAAPTSGQPTPSPFPDPPLRFSQRRVLKVLFAVSLIVIVSSIVNQLIFPDWFESIGDWRFVWLGVITMWLVVLTGVRKRRNFAKGTLYLLVILWFICVYWDYFTGWEGWSLTYAIPIVASFALVAVLIVVWTTRIEVGEHIIYSALTAVLGLVPAIFLILHKVSDPIPSIICVALSVFTLIVVAVVRWRHIRHELGKRFDL